MAEIFHPVRHRLLVMDDVDDHIAEPASPPRVDDERKRLAGHGAVDIQEL